APSARPPPRRLPIPRAARLRARSANPRPSCPCGPFASCGDRATSAETPAGHPDCTPARIARPPETAAPVSSSAMPSSSYRPDLRILTPLRGIAALWVVVYHFGDQYLPALRPEQAGHLVGKGYLAVDLFFMLSG